MKAALILTLLVAGCGRGPQMMQGRAILCSLDGKAYVHREGAWDTSFLSRQPDADPVCTKTKNQK